MKWINDLLQSSLLDLRIKHKLIITHQAILIPEETTSLSYAVLELKKAILEFKISIIRALLGES